MQRRSFFTILGAAIGSLLVPFKFAWAKPLATTTSSTTNVSKLTRVQMVQLAFRRAQEDPEFRKLAATWSVMELQMFEAGDSSIFPVYGKEGGITTEYIAYLVGAKRMANGLILPLKHGFECSRLVEYAQNARPHAVEAVARKMLLAAARDLTQYEETFDYSTHPTLRSQTQYELGLDGPRAFSACAN